VLTAFEEGIEKAGRQRTGKTVNDHGIDALHQVFEVQEVAGGIEIARVIRIQITCQRHRCNRLKLLLVMLNSPF